jgi:mRNA interferase MazF
MRRGDIFVANLAPRSGSERAGTRPVLVVSHDGFNATPAWRSVVVVPLSTSAAQAARGPTSVPIPGGAGGLARDGIALCHQVTTVDRAKLLRRLGTLPADHLAAVDAGLKAALDLR